MQSVPLKKTQKIDISSDILKWIKKNYGRKVDPALVDSIEKVQKQRDIVYKITTFKSMQDITDMKCYLSYLDQIEKALPLSGPKSIDISWTWTDCYSGKKYYVKDILFEKACVLFNIAALYTVAAFEQYNVEDLSLERIELCIDHLKMAALYFREIRQQYCSRLEKYKPGKDLSSDAIQAFEAVCIAQGQHIYFIKAKEKRMSPKVFVVLERGAAEKYKEVCDLMKENNYYPSGLVKHYELESYMTSLGALHYLGEYYMQNPEANSGVLYKIADVIDDMSTACQKLLGSFHVEYADSQQAKTLFDIIKDDKSVYYKQYRIYMGSVPSILELPPAAMKMDYAEDLQITEIPLSLPLPENADVITAITKYQERFDKIKAEMETLCKTKDDEMKKLLSDYLLPDILNSDGFGTGLPVTIEKRLKAVHDQDSIRGLQMKVSQIESVCLNLKDNLSVVKTQIPSDSDYYEVIRWAEKNMGTCNDRIKEVNKNIATMSKKPIIFIEDIPKLKMSLPTCVNYPDSAATMTIKTSTEAAVNLLSQRDSLLRDLLMDKSGEQTVRSRIQADGNLLNIETVLFAALQTVNNLCQQIKDNCEHQKTVISTLKSQYSAWNKKRTVTSEMKKREDALRDVCTNLNIFEESTAIVEAVQQQSTTIQNSLSEIMEKYGIN